MNKILKKIKLVSIIPAQTKASVGDSVGERDPLARLMILVGDKEVKET
jgi:hypothetical protein